MPVSVLFIPFWLWMAKRYDKRTAYRIGMMVWVLAASLPFVGIGVARGTMLTIRGWLWTAPLTTLAGLAVNVALNLLLIPRWGGIGAACATVVSYWLAAHGTCFLLPWLRPTGRELTRALSPLSAGRRLRARWQGRAAGEPAQ